MVHHGSLVLLYGDLRRLSLLDSSLPWREGVVARSRQASYLADADAGY